MAVRQTPTAASVPAAAAWLGAAGLIPFAAGCAGLWLLPDDARLDAVETLFLGYSAVILSFMGAVHWGLAMGRAGSDAAGTPALWRPMTISVVPALLAWVALALPAPGAVVLFTLGFAGIYLADRSAIRAGLAPPWYARLRLPLSLAVIGIQLAALTALTRSP